MASGGRSRQNYDKRSSLFRPDTALAKLWRRPPIMLQLFIVYLVYLRRNVVHHYHCWCLFILYTKATDIYDAEHSAVCECTHIIHACSATITILFPGSLLKHQCGMSPTQGLCSWRFCRRQVVDTWYMITVTHCFVIQLELSFRQHVYIV